MWPFNHSNEVPSDICPFDTWPIVRTRPVGRTYGRSIALFINNGSCHLTTIDVYEDGSINCWGFVDREIFQRKLGRRWVVPAPKPAQAISCFNFGDCIATEGIWLQTAETIAQAVDAIIRDLNPAMTELLDMNGSDVEKRGKTRFAKMGLCDKKPYRRDGTEDILGSSFPVLRTVDQGHELTRLVVYADGVCQLGSSEDLLPIEEVPSLYADDRISNVASAGSRILLPGLGELQADSDFGSIGVADRVAEINDARRRLNGEPSLMVKCAWLFEVYERERTPQTKERLRLAYEAVPRHLRCFCGDMDTQDTAIRAALYGDDAPETDPPA